MLASKNTTLTFRHMDGHHKLIRWRFLFHGCIDGFLRTIVFLHCSDNNRAQTVLNLFLESIHTYRIPARIRSDHGMENIEVARWMLQRHGVETKPFLTGLSVHNQRIERLWRDLVTYVVSYFRGIFFFMEENEILDPLNEMYSTVSSCHGSTEAVPSSANNGITIRCQLRKVELLCKFGVKVCT